MMQQFGMWNHGMLFPVLGGLALLALLWSLAWKGWALWFAARRGEKIWFVVLLLVNTFGILDIIYIFLVAKRSDIPEKTESVAKQNTTVVHEEKKEHHHESPTA